MRLNTHIKLLINNAILPLKELLELPLFTQFHQESLIKLSLLQLKEQLESQLPQEMNISDTINLEFLTIQLVDHNWITPSQLLDTDQLIVVINTSSSETHGELHGVRKDISEWLK